MVQEYNEYLAIHVLNEQQLVSYRSLSRALKVHSNLAKQMLYEFHRKQNEKKPGAVHATYLITGLRRSETAPHTNGIHEQDGEDTVMQSSPPMPSSSAARPDEIMDGITSVRSIMLVKEEHLEQAKSTFEAISSIHIYSLEANGLSDVQSLTECNRKIAGSYASEDPLQAWKQYGTIQNPNVKRRAQRTVPQPPPPPVVKDAVEKTKPFATTAKSKEAEMKADANATSNSTTAEPEKKGIPKPVQAKRQNSDIFKSFAKGVATKALKEESQSSVGTPHPEDEPMGGFSDDGMSDDDPAMDPEQNAKAPAGKSKKEREADLQAMMEQEDEPMDDAAEPDEPNAAIDRPKTPNEEELQETMVVENGRRRGKRRVMMKKTVKDEDGYLVTKEEAAWESFSEEEPAPKKIKAQPAPPVSTNAGGKAGAKKGGKPGQGNIMSFFSKK